MNEVRLKAHDLRIEGFSYNEINKLLGIPKSTLSGWFSNMNISETAKLRLSKRVAQGTLNGLVKRNKLQTKFAQERSIQIRYNAEKEINNLSKKDLYLAGIVLYWAEGYKRVRKVRNREVTNHPISFTNSDEVMIKIFISFLKNIMHIEEDKIAIELRIFKHMNKERAVKYWSKMIGLPEKNFKSISTVLSLSSLGKRPFNRLPYGTVAVRVCDTKQFHRLMGWISGLQKSLEHLC